MLGRKKTTSKKKKKVNKTCLCSGWQVKDIITENKLCHDRTFTVMILAWAVMGRGAQTRPWEAVALLSPRRQLGPVRLPSLLHKALQDSTVPKLAFLISNTKGISQWTEVSQWLGSFKLFVVLFCFDTWFCYTAQASLELAAIFLLLTFHLEVGGF